MKKVYSYQIHLIPDEEGGYTVLVPALPGCVSYGKTAEEATKNAKEAIELHLENLRAHKQPVPEDEQDQFAFTTFVQVTSSRV